MQLGILIVAERHRTFKRPEPTTDRDFKFQTVFLLLRIQEEPDWEPVLEPAAKATAVLESSIGPQQQSLAVPRAISITRGSDFVHNHTAQPPQLVQQVVLLSATSLLCTAAAVPAMARWTSI